MKKILGLLFSIAFLLFFLSAPVRAQVVKTSETNISIAPDEIVDDDLFITGENVIIAGTVKGNVFVAGSTVKVTGEVEGELLIGGGMVEISGAKVGQSVFVAGGQISLTNTQVGGSVLAGGGSLDIDSQTEISGMLLAGGGQIRSQAQVQRNVVMGGGVTQVGGKIGRDLMVGAGSLRLESNLEVGRDFTYSVDEEATIPSGVSIGGKTKQILPKDKDKLAGSKGKHTLSGLSTWQQLGKRLNLGFRFWAYLAGLLVGAVLFLLFPRAGKEVGDIILQKPWQSLAVGFIAVVLVLPAAMFLFMSLIGIPLAVLMLVLFGIEVYLTKVFVGFLFGRSLLEVFNRRSANPYVTLALGLIVFYILTGLWLVGFLVSLATLFFGLGAMLIYQQRLIQASRQHL